MLLCLGDYTYPTRKYNGYFICDVNVWKGADSFIALYYV